MKRSGFTMIELIFVIVILGILASVAIPKLAATRDDAKVSKVLNEVATLKGDFSAFYTAKGSYATGASKIQDLTNVELYTNATCKTKATAIASGTKYYYCTQDGANSEVIMSMTPKDTKGEWLIADNASAKGNIGKSVQALDSFKKLAHTVENGGNSVKF